MNFYSTLNKRFICNYDTFVEMTKINNKSLPRDKQMFMDSLSNYNILSGEYTGKNLGGFKIKMQRNKPTFLALSENGTELNLDQTSATNDIEPKDEDAIIYFLEYRKNFNQPIEDIIVLYIDFNILNNDNSFVYNNITGINYNINLTDVHTINCFSRDLNWKFVSLKLIYPLPFIEEFLYIDYPDLEGSNLGIKTILTDDLNLGLKIDDNTNVDSIKIEAICDTNEDSNLITESKSKVEEELILSSENYLPVGTLLPVWRTVDGINKSITNNFLKCDGSAIPINPKYNKLKKLLNPSISYNKTVNQLFGNNFSTNVCTLYSSKNRIFLQSVISASNTIQTISNINLDDIYTFEYNFLGSVSAMNGSQTSILKIFKNGSQINSATERKEQSYGRIVSINVTNTRFGRVNVILFFSNANTNDSWNSTKALTEISKNVYYSGKNIVIDTNAMNVGSISEILNSNGIQTNYNKTISVITMYDYNIYTNVSYNNYYDSYDIQNMQMNLPNINNISLSGNTVEYWIKYK